MTQAEAAPPGHPPGVAGLRAGSRPTVLEVASARDRMVVIICNQPLPQATRPGITEGHETRPATRSTPIVTRRTALAVTQRHRH